MKRDIYSVILFLSAIFLFQSCEERLLSEQYTNTPEGNFTYFWDEFDKLYGAFEAKQINWDSLKYLYSENIGTNTSDKELFHAISGLLNELNDGHADLYSPQFGYYRSWNRREKSFFSDLKTTEWSYVTAIQNTIRKYYLNNHFESGNYSNWLFFYGVIPYNNIKIGYICIPTFNIADYPNEFIQEAVDSFNSLDAVIIDLRYNGGGTTEAFVSSLNSFASEKKLYMKSKYRNGPEQNDFTTMAEHWTKPHFNCLKSRPTAILMNSFSASSSDHFILGMKCQSNVITVGDSTCGAFSSVYEKVLPNGWKFRLGSQVIYSPEGTFYTDQKENYLEGTGIAPDYYITDEWKSIIAYHDKPLDKALSELLKRVDWNNQQRPQDKLLHNNGNKMPEI